VEEKYGLGSGFVSLGKIRKATESRTGAKLLPCSITPFGYALSCLQRENLQGGLMRTPWRFHSGIFRGPLVMMCS